MNKRSQILESLFLMMGTVLIDMEDYFNFYKI